MRYLLQENAYIKVHINNQFCENKNYEAHILISKLYFARRSWYTISLKSDT